MGQFSRRVNLPLKAQNFSSAGDQTSNQDTLERSIVSSQFRRINGGNEVRAAAGAGPARAEQAALALPAAASNLQNNSNSNMI